LPQREKRSESSRSNQPLTRVSASPVSHQHH